MGWWKISMDHFVLVENSPGGQVEMFTARCSRDTCPGEPPLTSNRKVRVVGRCCASWGVIYVTGASIFFRRCPGFCVPSSCAEFSTRSRHRFPGTSGFVLFWPMVGMRRSIVSKRPGRKLGGCLTHHWNGVLVTASTVPNHQTRGEKLGKELVSPSLLLQLQCLIHLIWQGYERYVPLSLLCMRQCSWDLLVPCFGAWATDPVQDLEITIDTGKLYGLGKCVMFDIVFFMYDCSWPTSLEPFPIKTSVIWVPGT